MDLDRPYLVDDEEFDLEYHDQRKPEEIFTLARRFITMLTNVPGLNADFYFAGAQSIEGLGIGPPVPGVSLFLTATSFVVNKRSDAILLGQLRAHSRALNRAGRRLARVGNVVLDVRWSQIHHF